MSGKKILVTGGCGFIGSHLIPRLLSQDDVELVYVVDNLANSQANKAFLEDPRVLFDPVSVKDYYNSQDELTFDQIYHLASPVGPAGVLNYAGIMAPMIIEDCDLVARIAIQDGARLLDISTSEVYGKDPGEIPQREDIPKIVPPEVTVRLEYGVAKMASEVFLYNRRSRGLKVNFIRPFNIVGVGQNGAAGFVLPRFVEQALSGQTLTVFGDGSQRRTFTAVSDIVEAMIMIMDAEHVEGEVFNVGNPLNDSSILDLAKMVVRLSNSESRIETVDPKTIYGDKYAEAWNKIPNVTKIRNMLGWCPRFSLEDIVREVIDVAIAERMTTT